MKKLFLVFVLLISFHLFGEKPRIAVMDIVDESGTNNAPKVLKSVSQIIRNRIIKYGRYAVVAEDEKKVALAEMWKKHKGSPSDDAFYIDLGKKLGVARIIKPKVNFMGENKYIFSAILTDVELEVDETAADAVFSDKNDDFEKAVDKVIHSLLEIDSKKLEEVAYHKAVAESLEVWTKYILMYEGKNAEHTEAAKKVMNIKFLGDTK